MKKLLQVRFISTVDQLVDGFTKALPQQRFCDFQNNLNPTLRLREDIGR
jgi:hypothetical protein